jgi:flavin-dependent dehydrogenase
MRDLVVAGGGPAGLATAILARQRGLSVAVVEPRAGTVDKACGEGLMPAAVAALAELGVTLPRSHPFHGVRYVAGRCAAAGRFRGGSGLGVRRTVLHDALRARAEAVGVTRIEGRITRLEDRGDRVLTDVGPARYVVAADGLRSGIRRRLGLDRPPRRPRRLGVRRHFQTRPWTPMVEVHWSRHAEAYVTPVDEDLVGVAILYFPDRIDRPSGTRPYEHLLAGFPELRDRLGTPASDVRGAGPFAQRAASPVHGRILLVGDAAGYLDPLTGEGIRLSLDTARAAVDALAADRPADYARGWRRAVRRYWWMTDGLLRVSRAGLTRRWLVPTLRHVPGVMTLAIDALGGRAPRGLPG